MSFSQLFTLHTGGPSMLRAPILNLYKSPLIRGYEDINIYFLPTIQTNTPDG
jgi:hypothetical protein